LKNLPDHIQQQARKAYQRFEKDPSHPGLKFKKIAGVKNVYSVRITLEYRALGNRVDDMIIWFWIGSHSDYEQQIQRIK